MENIEYQKIIEDLKLQIKEAKSILDILVPLTGNGEIYKTLFEEIGKQLDEAYKDISKSKSLNTKYGNELKKSQEEIDNFIDESKKTILELKSIQSTLKDLETNSKIKGVKIDEFHKNTLILKKEIDSKKKEIIKLFNGLSGFSKKAEEFLNIVKENKISRNEILKFLEKIQKQAEKNIETLNGYLKNGKETFDKIELQSKKIDNFEKLSSDNTSKIQDYFNNIFTPKNSKPSIKDEINNILQKIKSQQETIDQQINISTSNRLCNAFQDKVIKLENDFSFWNKMIFGLTIALILVNISLILISPILSIWNIKFTLGIFEHVGIIMPLAILFGFAILEHSRIKKILDEYSFKYISAFSMPAYFELLENKNANDATKFLIDTINDIYKNPSNKINENSKITFFDYFLDYFKGLKNVEIENRISLPELNLKGKLGNFNIDISKDK